MNYLSNKNATPQCVHWNVPVFTFQRVIEAGWKGAQYPAPDTYVMEIADSVLRATNEKVKRRQVK